MFWLRLLIGCLVHELVRLYVHIILVVIEPLLIIMRVLIIKAAMRPLIDYTDEYHWSTARAFSVVAFALGVNSLVPRSQRNQRSSAVVSASARYSASVLERATTDCFLLRQEMRESPRRKQYPVVERRSVGSPAQSASE